MKKLLLTIIFLVLSTFQVFAGNLGDISNVGSARITTNYDESTAVRDMDTITFGNFGGKDIEWIVLENEDDKALLLSKDIILSIPYVNCNADNYVSVWNNTTWENSNVRNYLNNQFINQAFNNNEKTLILSTGLDNSGSGEFNTKSESDTIDKVYVLSTDEINNYLPSNTNRIAYQTKYAYDMWYNAVNDGTYNYDYNADSVASYYMLRDIPDMEINDDEDNNFSGYQVSKSGKINHNNLGFIDGEPVGVRPAMWVLISNNEVTNETDIDKEVLETTIEETTIIETTTQETTIPETTIPETTIQETTVPEVVKETVREIEKETVISDELSDTESYHMLSEKHLKRLEEHAIFTATYNIKGLRWIRLNIRKDGFLQMFGNDVYYVSFEYKNRKIQEDYISDYALKHHTEDDTDIEDCLGNCIREIPMPAWSSLEMKMYSKEAAEEVINFIKDGNDYTLYFNDTLIESTGKLVADPNTAIFDIEIPAKMISQTRPIQSRIPNSRLELNDLGYEIVDGVNVWVDIGDEAYYVQICTKDYDFNSEYHKKIADYYFGHRDTGFNVIDSLGHNIKLFCYGGFGNYDLYTDSMQDAKEISSYLNTSNAKYKLYFYDKVLESTGTHTDIDISKAKFKAKFSKDMIEWAKPEKTREMHATIDPIGGTEILGIPFGVSYGQDLYEVTVNLKKDFDAVTQMLISYYDMGFRSTGQKIFDNYGHKIIRAYDESFNQFIIYADTWEEAEEISSELNSSNCDYTLYYFDNVIESTGRYKPDASKADLTIEILDKYNRYSTAQQDTQKQLSVGWDSIGIEDGGAIYYVSTHLVIDIDNDDNISKMKGSEIYDSLGHKILKMEYSSGYDYCIYTESFTDAQEIASYMNMTDSVYKIYFYK